MGINYEEAQSSGTKPDVKKHVRSFSIDKHLLKDFINHCSKNNLAVSPIVENLIKQFMDHLNEKNSF
jgi:hypothetical protein